MDLIFSECVQLTKEFEELLKLLRDLNDCNFSLKEKCKNCRKYTFNCKDCFKEKCKNCDLYLKTKDILLNCKNKVIVNYVKSFCLIIVKFLRLPKNFLKLIYHLILLLVLMKKNQIVKKKLTEKNCIKHQYNFKGRKRNFYLKNSRFFKKIVFFC